MLREDEKVSTIGQPLDRNWDISINTKVIERLSDRGDPRKFLFTTTGIARESSGGPIFNEQGGLIGIVKRSSEVRAIAVKIDAALSVLREEWGRSTPNLTRP